MQKHLTKFLLVVCVLGFVLNAAAADRWETLHAINLVENPTNQTRIGRYGELGPYQFRPATWRMHTSKPFSLATQRAVADEIAVKHYEWIRQSLERAGVEADSFNIAMAWNCGVEAVVAGRAPTASFNYAKRVSNLVESFKTSERTATVPNAQVDSTRVGSAQEGTDYMLQFRFQVLQNAPRFVIASS